MSGLLSSELEERHRPFCVQAWAENKVPMMPPGGDLAKDRKVEQKVDMKKRTQAEMEQEMAALQYTNPMLLEVRPTAAGWTTTPPRCSRGHQQSRTGTSGVRSDHSLFLLAFPANEDGSDEPDELRRERGPPSGTGPAVLLRCCCRSRGPRSSWSTGVFSKHATSTDVQQHGSPHGPWEHAAVHAPRADGASLRSTGYDGTTRHAGPSRYAETFWPSPEHGSTRTSWHGP